LHRRHGHIVPVRSATVVEANDHCPISLKVRIGDIVICVFARDYFIE